MEIVYVANSNLIELDEVFSKADEQFVDTATVVLTAIKDKETGDVVGGEVFPKAMDLVPGSDRKYRCIVDEDIEIIAGRKYTAVIDLDDGPGRIGHWDLPLIAKTRTDE